MSSLANVKIPASLPQSHPFYCKYTVGTLKGVLHAIQMDYYNDAGAYIFDSDATVAQAMTTCDNCYYCPNWLVTPHVRGIGVGYRWVGDAVENRSSLLQTMRTNLQSNTWCRAPGCYPAIYFMETVMEALSVKLGKAPADFRLANLYQNNQVEGIRVARMSRIHASRTNRQQMTPMHQPALYCSIGQLWADFYKQVDYENRMANDVAFNKANRWRYGGRGKDWGGKS